MPDPVRRRFPGGTEPQSRCLTPAAWIDAGQKLRDFYQAAAYNARVIGFISTVPDETKGEDLDILARLVADGRLAPQIGWSGDWTRMADAFAALAKREFAGQAGLKIPY